jgi:glutamate-5-semialdehyde dehydrogenase
MADDTASSNPDELDALADKAGRVAESARSLATQPSRCKDDALHRIAETLRDRTDDILEANKHDVQRAAEAGRDEAFLDRLRLDASRITSMASDVEEVIELDDPVGATDSQWVRPNGLKVGRQRIPLGVVGLIYESRPNVTSDATSLCIKSGNGILLKGGSDAFESNKAIYETIRAALETSDLPPEASHAVGFVDTTEREAVRVMLGLDDAIDVVIPRGGPGLIQVVTEHAAMPVIKHDAGVCHVVVDGSADPEMVDDIVLNAKTDRVSVCNAAETLLLLESAVEPHLGRLLEQLADLGVTLHVDEPTREVAREADVPADLLREAGPDAYAREFLSDDLAVKIVPDLTTAREHIAEFGSSHTEAILTDNYSQSQRFIDEVDSSVVLVNASTRFSDGNQLGLGAEIGISTTRLHAYGPMGVEELTTTKFVVVGHGQVRD